MIAKFKFLIPDTLYKKYESSVMSWVDVWRFNPLQSSYIFTFSDDLRRIKHKGTGKEGSDADEWNLALCSVSTQRSFRVRILRNKYSGNLWIGMVQLDHMYQMGGFHGGHWYLSMDYSLKKCSDYELDEEYKGKQIPEGAVITIDIDDKRRALSFKVNEDEIYSNIKTNLVPEKFARLVGAVNLYWKDDEIEILDPEWILVWHALTYLHQSITILYIFALKMLDVHALCIGLAPGQISHTVLYTLNSRNLYKFQIYSYYVLFIEINNLRLNWCRLTITNCIINAHASLVAQFSCFDSRPLQTTVINQWVGAE